MNRSNMLRTSAIHSPPEPWEQRGPTSILSSRKLSTRIRSSGGWRSGRSQPVLWRPGKSNGTTSFTRKIRSAFRFLGVCIPNPAEVLKYLFRFAELTRVVYEVVRIAAQKLPDAQLILGVYHDPEMEDEYLILYARFHSYDETTMNRIRMVREKYRPLLKNKSGWIILTTDFQPLETAENVF